MSKQISKFSNVEIESIKVGIFYADCPDSKVTYRSPEKIKSLNGEMEYHYILEHNYRTPSRHFLVREEYFGDKVRWSRYEFLSDGGLCSVWYSDGKQYDIKNGKVLLSDNTTSEAQPEKPRDAKEQDIDQKLNLINERLEKLEAKFSGEYRLDVSNTETDNEGTPIRYFGAMSDDDTVVQPNDLPVYPEPWVDVRKVVGKKFSPTGEDFFIVKTDNGDQYRASKDTIVAHLLDFSLIEMSGHLSQNNGWFISDGTLAFRNKNNERTVLSVGTMIKALTSPSSSTSGEFVPGILAVLYPNYTYPSFK